MPDLDPGAHQFEFLRDGELCTVGGSHFILANIELPYREHETFVYTCWILIVSRRVVYEARPRRSGDQLITAESLAV
jgi:hypothetical protein